MRIVKETLLKEEKGNVTLRRATLLIDSIAIRYRSNRNGNSGYRLITAPTESATPKYGGLKYDRSRQPIAEEPDAAQVSRKLCISVG